MSTDVERDIQESKLLIAAIQVRDGKTADLYTWRLADLAAKNTRRAGGDTRKEHYTADGALFSIPEWSEKIDWEIQGNSVSTLRNLVQASRKWPKDLRVSGRTIEQHRDALAAHKTVEEASAWLHSLKGLKNVRDRARNIGEITGSGPVFDATLKLIRARKEIVAVPGKLAKSGILGNEANFPQFRRELERLKNAIIHLDNYLSAETVVDTKALDDALAKILAGEEV